jgi:hypothetical protein
LKHLSSFFLFLLLFLQGCSDNASVNIFDEKLSQTKIECMRLVVFPPDAEVQKRLEELYSFDDSCAVKLEISLKRGIVCNSNQNSDKKALSNFPTSYLRMQISKNRQLFYSYYIDLIDSASAQDAEIAFKRIKKDLIF